MTEAQIRADERGRILRLLEDEATAARLHNYRTTQLVIQAMIERIREDAAVRA